MAIFLKNSWNVPPVRWGSFADVQYAIKVNSEKVYNCNPDNHRIVMPMFWGFPLLDYSDYRNHLITNYGLLSKNSEISFGGSQYASISKNSFDPNYFTCNVIIRPRDISNYRDIIGAQGGSLEYRIENTGKVALIKSGTVVVGTSDRAIKLGATQSIAVTYSVDDTHWAHYLDGEDNGSGSSSVVIDGFNYLYLGRSQYLTYYFGGMLDLRIEHNERTPEQIKLFSELPYALYQKVSRPSYFFPIVAPPGNSSWYFNMLKRRNA